MRSLIELVIASLVCIVVDGQAFGANDEDVLDCFTYVMCHPEQMKELRNVISYYKPKAMTYFMQMVKDNSDIPDAENNDATWARLPGNYCPRSEESKKEVFTTFGRDLADYWGTVCEDEDEEEECDGIGEVADGFGKLISENRARDNCGSSSKGSKASNQPAFGR